MIDWLRENQTFLWAMAALSVATFVGTLLLMPLLIVRMPADYFVHRPTTADSWWARHYVLRLLLLAIKNALGVLFLIAGIVMLAFPGQGVLTMLIGITLLNFPGKRRLELWFVRQPTVLRAINWIRTKAKRPPLILPPPKRVAEQPKPASAATLSCPADPTSDSSDSDSPKAQAENN